MYEDFIQTEMAHFDARAKDRPAHSETLDQLTRGELRSFINGAYLGWLNAVRLQKKEKPARILDYCAGIGHHTVTLQSEFPEAEVVGIDISAPSLAIAKAGSAGKGLTKLPLFLEMDAHKMDFPDNYFDLISDFGSLSSLDFNTAMTELLRVLRPGGVFIAIETFGHNPLTNLNRRFNRMRGTRTQWACANILNQDSIQRLRGHFAEVLVEHHTFFSLILGLLPFQIQGLCEAFGRFDRWFLGRNRFLQKFAFKVVVVARKR